MSCYGLQESRAKRPEKDAAKRVKGRGRKRRNAALEIELPGGDVPERIYKSQEQRGSVSEKHQTQSNHGASQ